MISLLDQIMFIMKKSLLFLFILLLFNNINYIFAENFISPTQSLIEYSGRIDFSNPEAPRFSYSGISIRCKFQGSNISVKLDDDGNNNVYNIIVDHVIIKRIKVTYGVNTYILASGLIDTTHEVEIYKLTETGYGKTKFLGFILDGGSVLVPLSNPRTRLIEYIGNSIICGFGVEGDGVTSVSSNLNENHYVTYAAITSHNFNALHMAVSKSGVGLYVNAWDFVSSTTESIDCMRNRYTRIYFDLDTPKYNFEKKPDLICCNLGTNDFNLGVEQTKFENAYLQFIDTLQVKNQGTDILCLVGPMLSGDALTKARKSTQSVVTTANSKHKGNVYFYELSQQGTLGYGSGWHPSVEQNVKTSQELTNYISSIKAWPIDSVSPYRIAENPKDIVNGLKCEYYQGTWDALPDFETLTPICTEIVQDISLDTRNKNDYFGFKFTGYIDIPTDGLYTFYISSDDGSKLFIGSTLVVNNDGRHTVTETSESIALKRGKHTITISYFDYDTNNALTVSYKGPTILKTVIPATVLYIENPNKNVISNPTFDNNTNGWSLALTNSATATIDSFSQTGYDTKVLKINPTSLGARPTSADKIQIGTNFPVVKDKTYAVKFKASADATRNIDLKIFKNVSPDYNSALSVISIPLTVTPTTFGPYLLSWRDTDSLRFSLNVSQSTIPIYLDDVEIIQVDGPIMKVYEGIQSVDDNFGSVSYDSFYIFGSVNINSSLTKTFTIKNTGSAVLSLTGSPKVLVTSAITNEFSLLTDPPTMIAAGTEASFQIKYTPSNLGVSTGLNTISIENNHLAVNPYNFKIIGTGMNQTALKKIDADANSELNIYPNPVSSFLKVELYAVIGELIDLEILDLQGRTVVSKKGIATNNGKNTVQLDVQTITSGIYIIKTILNKGLCKTRMLSVYK